MAILTGKEFFGGSVTEPEPTPIETPGEEPVVGRRRGIITSNQFLGPPPPPDLSNPVQAATVQDSPVGHTMDTYGQGWASTGQGWGSQALGMDTESYKWMDEHGFTKDGGLGRVFRAVNEVLLHTGAAMYQQSEMEHELEKGSAREAGVKAALESATGGAKELAEAVTEPG